MKRKVRKEAHTENTFPCAWVVNPKDKGRKKIVDGPKVYLSNNELFEIEMYNPTKVNVIARIEFNGIDNGVDLVLSPGERFYLDSHVNSNKKLCFTTDTNNDSIDLSDKSGKLVITYFLEQDSFYDIAKITQPQPYQQPYQPLETWYTTPTCNTNINNTNGSIGESIENSDQLFTTGYIDINTIPHAIVEYQLIEHKDKTMLSTNEQIAFSLLNYNGNSSPFDINGYDSIINDINNLYNDYGIELHMYNEIVSVLIDEMSKYIYNTEINSFSIITILNVLNNLKMTEVITIAKYNELQKYLFNALISNK